MHIRFVRACLHALTPVLGGGLFNVNLNEYQWQINADDAEDDMHSLQTSAR